ncbi:MAG: transferase hexapeptide repeat family protein [Salipiger thiooxidans]|uniref:transferase hexapeptide repeat family protein n=1 Tax=Salipiger thiooxidans TaxID=282683 RepID=UPI001CF95C0A|nr:transferase hexapeptide repeat family protein [Salipiger thiooxidans]
MAIWSWDGVVPVVAPSAFVHPEAVLIGDVIVGAGCYVGPGAVLRGDFGRITLEPGSNVQETCVAHAFPGKDVVVEERGHVGHGAVLHGCHIGRNALIGMNAVVMDEARIGENSIVGAMAFVRAGMEIPANVMAVGSPAKVLRELSEQEIDWKSRGTDVYRQLAVDAKTKLAPAQPLAEVEEGRRRVTAPEYHPLVVERAALSGRP